MREKEGRRGRRKSKGMFWRRFWEDFLGREFGRTFWEETLEGLFRRRFWEEILGGDES